MSVRRQIIAALSEDSLGGIATLADVERAEQLADRHRAEVLAEGAALVEDKACDADFTEDPKFIAGLRAAVELLTQAAAKWEEATADAATATPNFFQPGHTYSKLRNTWLFRCDHTTTHPDGGERQAFGWLRRNEQHDAWVPSFKSEGAWTHDGWTDITEDGPDA